MRGAIDLTLVAGQLFELVRDSALPVTHGPDGRATPRRDEPAAGETGEAAEQAYRDVIYDAMVVALSGRIFLDETVEATPEQVLRQIWEDHFILNPAAAHPG